MADNVEANTPQAVRGTRFHSTKVAAMLRQPSLMQDLSQSRRSQRHRRPHVSAPFDPPTLAQPNSRPKGQPPKRRQARAQEGKDVSKRARQSTALVTPANASPGSNRRRPRTKKRRAPDGPDPDTDEEEREPGGPGGPAGPGGSGDETPKRRRTVSVDLERQMHLAAGAPNERHETPDCIKRLLDIDGDALPQLGDVQNAITFMVNKWLHPHGRQEDMEGTLLHNFHLTLHPDTRTLIFQLNDTRIDDRNALMVAFNTEIHIITRLMVYLAMDMPEISNFSGFQRTAQRNMTAVRFAIQNGHRALQHTSTVRQAQNMYQNGIDDDEVREKLAVYPHHDSGIKSQLAFYTQHCTKTQKSVDFVMRQCAAKRLRRKESVLFRQIVVHPREPIRNAAGHLVCQLCNKSKPHHDDLGHNCPCAFKPKFRVDRSTKIGTFAWEPLPEFAEIEDFVLFQCSATRNPGAYSDVLERKQRVINHISTAVGDDRLPVLRHDMRKYGHVVAWYNGLFFCRSAVFLTYQEIKQSGINLQNLVANQFRPMYFFIDDYIEQIMGPPVSGPAVADWPEHLRRKFVRKNECCPHCHEPRDYHAKSRCTKPSDAAQRFDTLICTQCRNAEDDCTCQEFFPFYIDVSKGVHHVSTPAYSRILDWQFGHLPDGERVILLKNALTGRWYTDDFRDGEEHGDNDDSAASDLEREGDVAGLKALGIVAPVPTDLVDDIWNVGVFQGGLSRTGKSEDGQNAANNINPMDFTVLSNSAQKDFAFQVLFTDKGEQKWWQMRECGTNSRIPQGEIKQMSTHEQLNVNRKGKKVQEIRKFRKRIWLIGNSMLSLVDQSGDIVRRLIPFEFARPVIHLDGLLGARINNFEAPATLFVQSISYKWMREKYGFCQLDSKDPYHDDGRLIIPPSIQRYRENLQKKVNPVECFMSHLDDCESPMIIDDRSEAELQGEDRLYVHNSVIVSEFNKFRKERFRDDLAQSWSKDMYQSTYLQHGLREVTERKEWPIGSGQQRFGCYVIGLGEIKANETATAKIQFLRIQRQNRQAATLPSTQMAVGVTDEMKERADEDQWRRLLKVVGTSSLDLTPERIWKLLRATNTNASRQFAKQLLQLARSPS
jgi:hypothetical protein